MDHSLPEPPGRNAAAPGAEDGAPPAGAELVPGVYAIHRPAQQTLPVVLASPHSGRQYPASFLDSSRLDAQTLRRSEDCFVDEIFRAAAAQGAPLIAAQFARAFLDPNREAYELDPAMFEGPVPAYVNSRSPRAQAGLGTVPRIVAGGTDIYGGKLRFRDAVDRVERFYHPYHAALRRLVEETRARFGHCILVDCHSMPSIGLPPEAEAGATLDMVLGDCHGSACAPAVIATAERTLRSMGYGVARNAPYAGGHTTRHYGRPGDGVHALQIEINRRLYMDETSFERRPYLPTLAAHMAELVSTLAEVPMRRPAAKSR